MATLIIESATSDRKIQAIKELRSITGYGLKESKYIIDQASEGKPTEISSVIVGDTELRRLEEAGVRVRVEGRVKTTGTPMGPCPHLDDSTHDGTWCGYCNPALGGDRNRGVRRMADRWWIKVCPECNGMVGDVSQVHNETCPNRAGRMFVARDVEVKPA